jgi:hypothetical protein
MPPEISDSQKIKNQSPPHPPKKKKKKRELNMQMQTWRAAFVGMRNVMTAGAP